MSERSVTRIDHRDQRQRDMLNALMRDVYGFDFARWDAWDDRYRCYAIIEGNRAIANASAALMTLLTNGRPVPAVQIGAVATLPEYRGQGLARLVMEGALSHHTDRPAFLFAHQGVVDFYPRFGFRLVAQGRPFVTLAQPTNGGDCRRIPADAPDLVRRLTGSRRHSAILDVTDVDHIHRFHIGMQFADDLYLVPMYDAVVVARQKGSTLTIYDAICDRDVGLADLLAQLPFAGVTTVEFGFMPDWLCTDYQVRPDDPAVSDSYLFARGVDLGESLKFPYMATT